MRRLGLILALAALPFVASAQNDDGGGFLERLIEDNLSGAGRDVRIDGFSGALSSEATLDRLTIADGQGVWITLEDAVLDWNRSALLRGRLEVTRLSARSIDLARLPEGGDAPAEAPSPEAPGFQLPELPVAVNIEELAVQSLALGEPVIGTAVELSLAGSMSLAGGEGQANLELQRIDGQAGEFVLAAGYSNATNVLDLNLTLEEGAGGIVGTLAGIPGNPPIALSVEGSGPLDAFEADLALETDGEPRLTGNVTIGGDDQPDGALPFRATLGGDVAPLFAPAYRDFFGDDIQLVLAGTRGADGALEIPLFVLEADQIELAGEYAAGPDGTPTSFDLEGEIASDTGGPVLLPIPGEPTTVQRAEIAVGFDASVSEDWDGLVYIDGFSRPGFEARAVLIDGTGRIGDAADPGFTVDLDFSAENLDLGDPDVETALGETVTGRLRASGAPGAPLEIAELSVDGESYRLAASGTFDISDRDLAFDADADLSARDLSVLSGIAGRPLGGAADVSIGAEGALLAGNVAAQVTGQTRDLSIGIPEADALLAGSAEIAFEGARTAQGITVDRLEITSPNIGLDATARIATGDMAVRLTAALEDAGLVLDELDGRHTLDLDASSQGDLWTIDVALAGPAVGLGVDGTLDLAPANPVFDGRVTARVDDLSDFAGLAGRPSLAGAVDLTASGQAAVDLSGDTPRPDDFDLVVTGTVRDLGTGIPQADALLAGTTTLNAAAARMGDTIEVDRLRIASPEARIDASGRYGAESARVNADARVEDAGLLLDGLDGRHTLDLAASSEGGLWTIDAALAGPALGLDLDGTLDLAPESPVFDGSVNARADTLSAFADLANLPGLAGSLDVTAEGTIAADLSRLDAELTARGANLRTGIGIADEFIGGGTVLTFDGARDDGVISIRRARFASPALTARVEGDVSPDGGDLTAEIDIDNVGRVLEGFSGPGSVDLTASRTNGSPWRVDGSADGPGGTTVRADGTVATDLGSVDLAVNGTAPLGLANTFIAPMSLGGFASFDLSVDGPPALSSVSGRISTSDARLVAPTIGIVIDRTEGAISLSGARADLDLAAFVQGGGRIDIGGGLSLNAPFQGDISADLSRVRLTDPALYETFVSGNVGMNGPLAGGARIAGRLTLSDTTVRIPSGVSGGLAPIPDVTHVGLPPAARRTLSRAGLLGDGNGNGSGGGGGRPYPLDIVITAQNQIFVRGRGLDAELGGRLAIAGTTANVIPQGRFELIRGRLDILGQRIVLDEGSITLQGDFVPIIRLVAETETDDALIRIVVSGPADNPDIQFLSEPDLPEDEVLARLIFGRGIQNLSPLQAAQLAASVATLTGGGDGVLGRLRSGIGLDDLDVTSDGEGNAAVRAGAYLSDNVYTDLTVGSDGSAEIELNLDLTPSVTVTGRTNNDGESGIGIFYERNY